MGAAFLIGCATPQQQSDADLKAAADAIDQAAQEFENEMSPDERQAFHRQTEQSATAEMQAKAAACGTKLRFSNEPKFEDRTVFVDSGATAEQLACVQKAYPFVKGAPR